jgi:hypothetical protein
MQNRIYKFLPPISNCLANTGGTQLMKHGRDVFSKTLV